MNAPIIMERLRKLRATVRRRLLAYGVCAVLAGGVVAFLAIISLDWLLELPPLLRLVGGLAFLGGFFLSSYHWVVRPLGARLGLDVIAARIEERFDEFQDQLVSAVDFVEHGSKGSESLTRELVARTEALVNRTPLETALSVRPLARRAAALAFGVVALAFIVVGNRDWVQTGVYRYLYPFGDIEWPRRIALQPLTGHQTVAIGESVTVRMAVTRGGHEALRGLLVLQEESSGKSAALAMQRDADGTYYATVDAVTQHLTYWFEAGDASTQRLASTIRALRRPELVEATAIVHPPPYARELTPTTHDLHAGPAQAALGGAVDVIIRASKPIPPDPSGQRVGLRAQDGRFLPLDPDPADPHRLTARYPVDSDLHFRVELRDADSFENRGPAEFSIHAVPDAPPQITVLAPPAQIEVTPHAHVPIHLRLTDDFGLTAAGLEIERQASASPTPVPLTDHLEPLPAAHGVQATVTHDWPLAAYALSPGDRLQYRAVAWDNRVTDAAPGQRGESATLTLRVISDIEFDIRLRTDLAQVETRVRQLLNEEQDLHDRTRSLLPGDADPATLKDQPSPPVAELSAAQLRLIRRTREIALRVRGLTDRLTQNRPADDDGRRALSRLHDLLARTAADPMLRAESALSDARRDADPAVQRDALTTAAEHEQRAVDELRAVLRALSEWGSFQEMLTQSRALYDRQTAARTDTQRLSETMIGKPLDALTDEQRGDLRKLAREQDQLREDLHRLLTRMQQLITATGDTDRAGADALDDALRAARAQEADRHMTDAARALDQNRTAAAGISQKNAATALRRMVEALRERQTRELEELRKQLQQAEELVAQLLEDQQALRAASREAEQMPTDDEAFGTLADSQRRLSRNAALIAEDLARMEKALSAAKLVKGAADPMHEAGEYLRERQPPPALIAQDRAIALLEDAQAELAETAGQTEQELLRRSLGQIRENLDAVAQAQRDVNDDVAALKGDIDARGQLTRAEARVAANLARDQADVRRLLEEHLPDFDKVVVYRWALDRVLTWMTQSRERLDRREVDDTLVALGTRIVSELDKLIGAIRDTEALPLDMSFIETERGQGGGGEGAQMGGKTIPTVAELLVLKAMQIDISERTQQYGEAIDVETASEAQLQQLRALGEDQIEVRRLTEMVVNRAQEP